MDFLSSLMGGGGSSGGGGGISGDGSGNSQGKGSSTAQSAISGDVGGNSFSRGLSLGNDTTLILAGAALVAIIAVAILFRHK